MEIITNVFHSPSQVVNDSLKIQDEIFKEMMNKRSNFLQEKLIEKGYGWINNLPIHNRFNRLYCVRKGDWEYYFADNRTPEGEFIVAISDFKTVAVKVTDLQREMKISFDWKDELDWKDEFNLF